MYSLAATTFKANERSVERYITTVNVYTFEIYGFFMFSTILSGPLLPFFGLSIERALLFLETIHKYLYRPINIEEESRLYES